jgi:hypothetical protein
MASDFRKIRNPEPVIPGRKVDTQLGGTGQSPVLKRAYQLLRELENVKSEIGDVDVTTTPATVNDILVFNGTAWTPIDKTALLSLSELTDVVVTGVASGDVLYYDGTEWVNQPLEELLSLTDLSDVTLTAPSTGAFLVKTAGDWIDQNFTPGRLGVGTAVNPTHRLELEDGDYTSWFTGSVSNPRSGSRGINFSKAKTTLLPLAITFRTDGNPNWEVGMDFDTDNALSSGFGNSDFIVAGDHSANAGAGADTIRVSPEEASSVALTPKIVMGRVVGTPRDNTAFLTLDGGDDISELGGLRVRCFVGAARDALSLVTRATANNRVMMSYGDASETFWTVGTDAAAGNDKHFYFFDNVNNKTRLCIRSTTDALAKIGIGTASPVAALSVLLDINGASDDLVQRSFHAQIAGDPTNRAINIETIRKAGVEVWNYVWIGGGLGAGSTAATRVASSAARAWGWEGGDNSLRMAGAPAGTNQTITYPFAVDFSGGAYRVGFFAVTPQARPTAYTQTYSTADRTMANLTAAALTHGVGTADGTVDDVTAAHDQTILNNNFKELTDQIAKLLADVTDVKQGLNSVVDDLQGFGLLQ